MTVSTRELQRHVHATDDTHRVTSLELFFDLVFVYGLTQVTALMAAGDPTWHKALKGLLVLALLWFAWSSYAWLGNQAKADEGVLRLALVVAMICVFLVALAVPNAFGDQRGTLDSGLLLALGLVVARAVHLAVYLIAAGDDRGLRHQLFLTAVPVAMWAASRERRSTAVFGSACGHWPLPSTTSGSSSRHAREDGGSTRPRTLPNATG